MTGTQIQPTWFGHPRGLTVLFLTNMWEQFSYYGMRALLVYFMTKELLFGQAHASFIYGAYTAAAYFTPILGGMLADRVLGKRRAIIIGASVMAAGHFMMTFDAGCSCPRCQARSATCMRAAMRAVAGPSTCITSGSISAASSRR